MNLAQRAPSPGQAASGLLGPLAGEYDGEGHSTGPKSVALRNQEIYCAPHIVASELKRCMIGLQKPALGNVG
jgi:hypothetical protein